MTEKIYNRPSIDGKQVEGPLPFTDLITIVDIEKIGGNLYDDPLLTTAQIAHLAAFREAHPIYYESEDDGVEYPPEAFDFPRLEEKLLVRRVKQVSFGRRIVNYLIGQRGEQNG
jgi:hypothetical protein